MKRKMNERNENEELPLQFYHDNKLLNDENNSSDDNNNNNNHNNEEEIIDLTKEEIKSTDDETTRFLKKKCNKLLKLKEQLKLEIEKKDEEILDYEKFNYEMEMKFREKRKMMKKMRKMK
jgi:hypothetical protein